MRGAAPSVRLTQREQEIVLEVARGHNKQNDIARALCVSLSTVYVHLSKIYRKTGTHNQIQLIRWAFLEAGKTCRQEENDETTGEDNGNESRTVQATEPSCGDGGKIRGRT